MRAEIDRTSSAGDPDERRLQADRESAAVIGFISAIAAYGAFYIPKAYGSSIALSGGAEIVLWSFFAFYLSCAVLTRVDSSEEHTPEPQSLMRISYAVFCLHRKINEEYHNIAHHDQ